MREAIGGTWLFGLVITFIVFFASFLAVSINYSRAFNVKNNIVDIIGKYEGNNKCARDKVSSYLRNYGYLVTGYCPVDEEFKYIGYNLDGEEVGSGKKAYYCIANDNGKSSTSNGIEKKYYRVAIFFKIDLPIVGDLTSFKIKGETEVIYFPNEDDRCK